MSRHATDWLGENLAEITKTTLPNGNGMGRDGFVLLFYFCDRANKEGSFFMQVRTIMEETGLSMTAVKSLMSQFEKLGWITPTGQTVKYMGRGKPTPEYLLTCVPEIAQNMRTGARTGARPSTSTEIKANKEKASTKKNELELEPQPEPKPEPQPESTTSADRAGEVGLGNGELLAQVIAWEVEHFQGQAGQGLLKKWRDAYPGIVARALELNPPGNLVHWCIEQYIPGRTDYYKAAQPKTEPKHWDFPPMTEPWRGDPECSTCKGKGWYLVREKTGKLKDKKDCECAGEPNPDTHELTHEPTTERVSACEDTSTYLPTPDAPADSRSEIRQLSRQLFKRI